MVPHLLTAANGPILALEKTLLDATPSIERWFRLEWQEHTPPFYASVDLRNAGFKLAPVDTNLFPASIHLLSDDTLPLAVQAAMAAIDKYCADARHLLLIPQEPLLEAGALRNLVRLASVLRQTGLEVRFGSLEASLRAPKPLALDDGTTVLLEPIIRQGKRIGLHNFDPCAILLNNDLSGGLPPLMQGLAGQVLLPPLHAGWSVRRTSRHFTAYQEVSKRFAKAFGLDPWSLHPAFVACQVHPENAAKGVAQVQEAIDHVLKQMRAKYKEYGIPSAPFVIVKSNTGTRGRGVVSVKDAADFLQQSPALLAQLQATQATGTVLELMVQEGVPTVETVDAAAAEPVVYTLDRYVVGGFYRLNAQRGRDENLNAPGMRFKPLPFASSCNTPDCLAQAKTNRFNAYGVVARLALLAASIELERTDPDQALHGN
jgi:glutamate--cysteine ligase